jgi:3-oxoadipate enol-lactonase
VHHAQEISATIPGAELRVLEAVHLSNVEKPRGFLDAVLTFLRTTSFQS